MPAVWALLAHWDLVMHACAVHAVHALCAVWLSCSACVEPMVIVLILIANGELTPTATMLPRQSSARSQHQRCCTDSMHPGAWDARQHPCIWFLRAAKRLRKGDTLYHWFLGFTKWGRGATTLCCWFLGRYQMIAEC